MSLFYTISLQQWVLIAVLSMLMVYFAYLHYSKKSMMNMKLRSLNLRLIGFEFAMISFLIYEIYILHTLGEQASVTRFEQTQMFKEAAKLRQASNDLTLFARSYAATGDELYKKQYENVLGILDGKKPLPLRYDQIYWELNPQTRALLHPDEKAKSLDSIIDELPYSEAERMKLRLSKMESDDLVNLELRSFELVKNKKYTEAIQLLYSQEYIEAVHRIMLPIDEFFTTLDTRTNMEIERIEQEIFDQFLYILAIFAFFIIGNAFIFTLLRRKINDPIDYLTSVIRCYKENKLDVEEKIFFDDEIGEMQREFFIMHHLIDEKAKMMEKQRIFVQTLLNSLPNPIFYKDNEGKFIGFNEAYAMVFGIDTSLLLGKSVMDLDYLPLVDREIYFEEDNKAIREGSKLTRKQSIPFADGVVHSTIYSITGIRDQDGKPNGLIGTFTDITEMENTKKALEELYQKTRESIEYAALIQGALIPEDSLFSECFQDFFVIWDPKDTVGGDIYLFEKLRDNEYLLMLIDCTGHGVPGAFVTMLVKAIERQITARIKHSDEVVNPAQLLGVFNKSMKHLLKQESQESINNAGFDGAIIYYNKAQKILKFAGAQTALFYLEDDTIKSIKGDRYSVGYKKCDSNYSYTEHTLDVQEGMKFYVSSDGYLDQCGGEKGFSFGRKRFESLIVECREIAMKEQQKIFLDVFNVYQGNYDRNDDVTLLGFQL